MEALVTLLAPIVAGLVVGLLSGMLGLGGGTMLVPIFRLMFGMSPLAATATSLFTIIPTSLSGAFSHVRGKTCIVPLGLALGLGGALTSPLGVWLASLSPDWAVMAAAAVVIGYSSINMITKALRMPKGGAASASATTSEATSAATDPTVSAAAPADSAVPAPVSAVSTFTPSRKQLIQGACIGLGAGVISGYVGVGGGFIMIPLMLAVLGLPMKLASGTSLVAVLLLATPGVAEHMIMGNVDYWAGIAVAIGSIPGALVGARLARRVPEKALRLSFGCFLLVAAFLLVANEVGFLG